jgi:hypothetical protein
VYIEVWEEKQRNRIELFSNAGSEMNPNPR